MQSQARSATKDLTDAGTEAQFEAETGRLHNQFNFNDRAVQVHKGHQFCRLLSHHWQMRSVPDPIED